MQQRTTFRQACLVTLFSGLLLSGGSIYAKEWKSITIATEGGYEPWSLTLPGGKLGGSKPELVMNLCQQMQIECKLVVQSRDGMIAGLNTGRYDVIVDAVVVAPERSEVVAFTQTYAATSASFIAVEGSLLSPSPTVKLHDDEKEIQATIVLLRAALKGKTIGIASGTVYTPFVDERFKNIADIRGHNNLANTILDLQAEHIDAMFDDIAFANTALSRPENNNLALSGPLMSEPIQGGDETMGVHLAGTDLKARLDSAIRTAPADGTIEKLSEG